jgi:hypothetical protein
VRRPRPSSDADLHGWRVPVWWGFAVIGLALATLALLVNGPQPWRGTRWAWFWLMALASPLGVAAFLLLAAPTPLLGAPRADARRLTGGWAFLLGVVLSATLTSLA